LLWIGAALEVHNACESIVPQHRVDRSPHTNGGLQHKGQAAQDRPRQQTDEMLLVPLLIFPLHKHTSLPP